MVYANAPHWPSSRLHPLDTFDRGFDEEYAPIPSLLALSALHHHLVREGSRTQVALVVESGEPREIMHFCLLIGFGASAVNPYLAIETLEDLSRRGYLPEGLTFDAALRNYTKAVNKGLLKVSQDGDFHVAELPGSAGFRSHRSQQAAGG